MAYYIRHNKSSEAPRDWLFFQAETRLERVTENDYRHTFRSGMALYWRRAQTKKPERTELISFSSVAELAAFITDRKARDSKLMVVSADLRFQSAVLDLLTAMVTAGLSYEHAVMKDERQIWKLTKDRGSVYVLDLRNWFRVGLKQLHLMSTGETLLQPAECDSDAVWSDYTHRCLEAMRGAVGGWIDYVLENDLGVFANTVSGQSFNAYRHRFMFHKLLAGSDGPESKIARAAYYGGRVSAFVRGRLPADDYTLVDVNSLYPAMMVDNEYPTRPAGFVEGERASKAMVDWGLERCIAHCELETDRAMFPARQGNGLSWPVGRFQTTLVGPELAEAFRQGAISSVLAVARFHTASIFRDFVSYFWERRLSAQIAGDELGALMNKLILNSLSGKFAQQNDEWERIEDDTVPENSTASYYDCDLSKMREYRKIFGVCERTGTKRESRFSIPAISAFITSYARLHLWRLIEKAGHENVFYVDTDSLLVNTAGYERLAGDVDRHTLGALKVVRQSRLVEIWGPKRYRMGADVILSGVKRHGTVAENGAYTAIRYSYTPGNRFAAQSPGVTEHRFESTLPTPSR